MKTVRTRVIVLSATLLLALASVASAQSAAAAPRPDRGAAWGDSSVSVLFHVTLVSATKQGGVAYGTTELPKAVAKALDDIRDFLPYQGYRVVDSALVRASEEAHARLSGTDGKPMQADFVLQRVGSSTRGGAESFLVDHFRLSRMPRAEDLRRMAESGQADMITPDIPVPPLDASFRIDRGETVVVGSSRLDGGDGALIVLLTAVP